MKCHLVYSFPNAVGLFNKFYRKSIYCLQNIGLPFSVLGDRKKIDNNLFGISHPASAAKNLYKGFSSKMDTLCYHLREHIRIKFDADDIFIGHPRFPSIPGSKGVTELSLDQGTRPKIFSIISPIHCNIEVETNHINKAYQDDIDRLLPKVDLFFGIMGQYWWDQFPSSPYAHWLEKMVRIDLAVDIKDFPKVKNKFNLPGERGYLFIGRNDPMKGIDLLSKLLSEVGNFPKGWIGSGPEIPGLSRISPPRPLTPDFMKSVAERFDFFITTGIADPNPTTILESMAWGFPVICTPQSGYYETSYLRNVYHGDIDKSLETLRELQFAPEEVLRRMANEARRTVETKYNWENFMSTIFSAMHI